MTSPQTFDAFDCDPDKGKWVAHRLVDNAIIHAKLDPSIGDNIQGPSLIRVPSWIAEPLGEYYLYFADHKGEYIRLAYADDLKGPWHIHAPGSLHLRDSCFPTKSIPKPDGFSVSQSQFPTKLLHSREYEASTPHIASPDVLINHDSETIFMLYHGLESYARQRTRLATSQDGISFQAEEPILCSTYLKVVPFKDKHLGMVMPGIVFKLESLRGPYEGGTQIFPPEARHHALLVNQDRLFVFWTEVGEAPEHIKVTCITFSNDFSIKEINEMGSILKPETEWEGAFEPNEPSVRSVAYGRVNQLRDPCIYVEEQRVYMLYAGGGENAIGIAELTWEANS